MPWAIASSLQGLPSVGMRMRRYTVFNPQRVRFLPASSVARMTPAQLHGRRRYAEFLEPAVTSPMPMLLTCQLDRARIRCAFELLNPRMHVRGECRQARHGSERDCKLPWAPAIEHLGLTHQFPKSSIPSARASARWAFVTIPSTGTPFALAIAPE